MMTIIITKAVIAAKLAAYGKSCGDVVSRNYLKYDTI